MVLNKSEWRSLENKESRWAAALRQSNVSVHSKSCATPVWQIQQLFTVDLLTITIKNRKHLLRQNGLVCLKIKQQKEKNEFSKTEIITQKQKPNMNYSGKNGLLYVINFSKFNCTINPHWLKLASTQIDKCQALLGNGNAHSFPPNVGVIKGQWESLPDSELFASHKQEAASQSAAGNHPS